MSSVEMWFYRRMLRVLWMDKLSDETVLERAETCRTLITTIKKRQMLFFGHVYRKEKLEYLVSIGKLEGKRARGRQRESYVASM